jgi:hypothetical protein
MPNHVINALLARLWMPAEPPEPEPSPLEVHATSPMDIHIVDKQDIFYRKGRNLAEQAYRRTWNTEQLIDGNDYAVVVSHNGDVIGNMNLQLRSESKPLKSEIFFGWKHWHGYFNPSSSNVAELSALAIAHDLPSELSRPVMMMLILGIQSLCRLKNINLLVTVQHEFLIRVLKQSLCLPFLRNENIRTPHGTLPDDDYWNQKQPPRLYYLEPNHHQTIETCSSFLCYLNVAGVNTRFLPRVTHESLTYTAFRKSWQSQQRSLDLAI